MFETFDKDRYFIERKYHDPDAPFDPYKRMAYHGEGYDIDSGLDDEDIKRGLEAMKGRLSSLPHPVAKALAVAYVLEHQRLYVGEHDYFTGLYSLNRLANCVTSDVWSKQAQQKRSPELVERENLFNLSGAVDIRSSRRKGSLPGASAWRFCRSPSPGGTGIRRISRRFC